MKTSSPQALSCIPGRINSLVKPLIHQMSKNSSVSCNRHLLHSINGARNTGVYICSDTSREYSDLCSAVRRGSRGKISFGMDAVVSCALPVASTTGMSVSVPLPRTSMLACSSLRQTISSINSRRGGKKREKKKNTGG